MPFTVITLKSVPPSLRGDLTKWMQEIATGVFVGNFNTRVREELWKRVKDSVKSGEATISYTYRNETGYTFETINSLREVINCEGIPLIVLKNDYINHVEKTKLGFSNASKHHNARKYRK